MAASSSRSNNSSSTLKWEYDVFLSFAGKDTRLNFTDHLYGAFSRSGINCFKDDVDLPKGENIAYLFQAIQDSLCSVLVISPNYAKSKWCLDELQTILESQKKLGRRVFPIFYDVNPSDVRHQGESFKKAVGEHEEKFIDNPAKVQNWSSALSEISNLSGHVTRKKHEAEIIINIVEDVWTYLSSKLPSYHDNLIGIDLRVADLMTILDIGAKDMRFVVGIWGMGGAGKTTLARALCEKISHKFEVCCFLTNVRETLLQANGLVSMQERLLSHLKKNNIKIYDDDSGMKMIRKLLCDKKVLLVLDDLDDISQLKNLAESPNWFGEGSRIIITTRDIHLLAIAGVEKRIFEMRTMNKDESLQLFSNKAFNKDRPEKNFLHLSESIVKYAGGLPLALEVLGSFLFGRSEIEWRDALDRLKRIPNKDILQVLKISYDGLNEEEKTIFLDIACFFKGWRKKEVTRILKGCDLHATIGIKILIEKTFLIETADYRLEMHDLLEELDKYIVHQESPNNCSRRSRLWKFEDVKKVLENNLGSDAVEAIVIRGWRNEKIEVHPKVFSKMTNIRLLYLHNCPSLSFPGEMKLSAGALKFVQWSSFACNTFPLETPELVHIEMRVSQIKQLIGIQDMGKLKFMDLSLSKITKTPDFSRVPNLEHLILHYCTSLLEVHPSLGKLKKLAHVCLFGCDKLKSLPGKLENNSLIKLELGWCRNVEALPEFDKCMKRLSYLDVRHTAISRLPESLGYLIGLKDLKLEFCKNLNLDKLKTHITPQISNFNVKSLTQLYLSWCGLKDGSVLDAFGILSSLIVLDLTGNKFVELSAGCFSRCFQLLFLSLDYCDKLKSLPRLPPRLL